MTASRIRKVSRASGSLLLIGMAAFLLASCETAPVPLSDQEVLDRTNIHLPDTYPPGSPEHPRMVQALQSMGFAWNDPRFTMGRHLMRKNEVAWFDSGGTLHVTRYTGIFKETGYQIRRYVPSPSGDLEHRGQHVRPGLMLCMFDRPANAIHWHKEISAVDLLAEMAIGAPIDLLVTPFSFPLCLFSDRMPSTYLRAVGESDEGAVKDALRRYKERLQKGKPIPT